MEKMRKLKRKVWRREEEEHRSRGRGERGGSDGRFCCCCLIGRQCKVAYFNTELKHMKQCQWPLSALCLKAPSPPVLSAAITKQSKQAENTANPKSCCSFPQPVGSFQTAEGDVGSPLQSTVCSRPRMPASPGNLNSLTVYTLLCEGMAVECPPFSSWSMTFSF